MQAAQIDITPVPYRGLAPALNDLLAGSVNMMFDGIPALIPPVREGRLRALAVGSAKRVEYVPGLESVPAMDELLPGSGMDMEFWYSVDGPAGLPTDHRRAAAAVAGRAAPDYANVCSRSASCRTPPRGLAAYRVQGAVGRSWSASPARGSSSRGPAMRIEEAAPAISLRRGRPRSAAAQKKILAATAKLLSEGGFQAVTMEAGAARAGVAKTTLYRWWPNRAAVALDCVSARMTPIADAARAGSYRKRFQRQLKATIHLLNGRQGQSILALIGAKRPIRRWAGPIPSRSRGPAARRHAGWRTRQSRRASSRRARILTFSSMRSTGRSITARWFRASR
jgi:AcrR family transcriptional regulator